jgi:site-specific recombinase XerD
MATDLATFEPTPGTVATLGTDFATLGKRWLLAYASLGTRATYAYALGGFADFLAEHGGGAQPLEADRTHLDAWARTLEAQGRKPATVARNLAAVSSFYDFALSVGAVARNPASAVRRPKVSDTSSRLGLTLDTSRRVVEAAEAMSAHHRAAVALMLLGGLRVSEAAAVRAADLGEELGHTVLTVTGKGGLRAKVVLAPAALRLLAERLEAVKGTDAPLLSDEAGQPLTRHAVRRMVAAIGRRANLGRPLTAHDLRHGCATSSLEVGEPLHFVQAHLRHASPTTTQRYNRNRERLDNSAAYGLGRALAVS